MVSTQHAFISYSRKDYYFAESLAFNFGKRGIDAWLDAKDLVPGADWVKQIEAAIDGASCFILVVSRDSVKSTTVRREVHRARDQGKRIIALLFRRGTIQADWGITETIDFRGSFEPALEDLIVCLNTMSARAGVGTSASRCVLPRFSPWVSVTAACLLWPVLLVFSIWWVYPQYVFDMADSIQSEIKNAGGGPGLNLVFGELRSSGFYWGLLAVIFGLLVYYGVLEFLRRRMSMTRLALVFAFLLYVVGYPVIQHFFGEVIPAIAPGWIMRALQNAWPHSLWLFLSAITTSGLGLGIVLFKRPGDLLRWTPTGYAWSGYRREYAPGPAPSGSAAGGTPNAIQRFRVLHDRRDQPLADRLRHLLSASGAEETSDSAKEVTTLLLLTNCSRAGWIDQQVQVPRSRLLTLLATHLSPPESLDWLWRFHWIDFRTWDIGRLASRPNGLPPIPETLLQRPRFPPAIRLTHHGLCAVSALMWQVTFLAFPASYSGFIIPISGLYGINVTQLTIQVVVTFAWIVPARKLLKRTCSVAYFLWSVAACLVLTGLAIWWESREYPDVLDDPRVVTAILFLAAMALWILRQRWVFAHWFPLPATPEEQKAPDLAPTNNRQTLLWFSVYWFMWVQIFSQGQFAAY